MSGLEPLAVLGIACNIMQTLSFGHEVITSCKKYYYDGSADPGAETHISHHADLTRRLKSSIEESQQRPLTQEQTQLLDVANETHEVTMKLKKELTKLQSTPGSGGNAIFQSTKRLWRRHRIEELEKDVRRMTDTMQMSLLSRVCTVSEAAVLQQDSRFQKLDEDFRYFIQSFTEGHTKLANLVRNQADDLKKHSVTQHLETRKVISETVAQHEEKVVSDAACKTFLESFRFKKINQRKNDISSSHPKTYNWLFDESSGRNGESEDSSKVPRTMIQEFNKYSWDRFDAWLGSQEPCYWISGKPGSGKSTLMKFLAAHPSTYRILRDSSPQDRETYIISYFFLISGTELQRSVKGLMTTILYQVLSRQDSLLLELLKEDNTEWRDKKSPDDWSEDELRTLLARTLQDNSSTLCIFVDGLDEICPSDGPIKLLEDLEHIRSFPGVKMCVSSRLEEPFKQQLAAVRCLRLHQLIAVDIYRLADDKLRAQFKTSTAYVDEDSVHRLAFRIADKSEGVFLWAILAVKSLGRGISKKDPATLLERRLIELPSDLNRLYTDIWNRLNDDIPIYREQAALCFNLVLEYGHYGQQHDIGGITWLELLLAYEDHDVEHLITEKSWIKQDSLRVRCVDFRQLVATRCAGLLETESSDDPIFGQCRFIHRTVREFFLSSKEGQTISSADDTSISKRQRRLFVATLGYAIAKDNRRVLNTLVMWEWYCNAISALGPQEATQFPLILRYLHCQKYLSSDGENLEHLSFADGKLFRYTYKDFLHEASTNKPQYYTDLLRLFCSRESDARFPEEFAQSETAMKTIEWLLDKGANPNGLVPFSQNYNIYSPLTMFLLRCGAEYSARYLKCLLEHGGDLSYVSWGILYIEETVRLGLDPLATSLCPRIYIRFNGWALLHRVAELAVYLNDPHACLQDLQVAQGTPIFELILFNYKNSRSADDSQKKLWTFSDENAHELGKSTLEMLTANTAPCPQRSTARGTMKGWLERVLECTSGQAEDVDEYLRSRDLVPLGGNHCFQGSMSRTRKMQVDTYAYHLTKWKISDGV